MAKPKKPVKKKGFKVKVYTGPGRYSFPHLAEPNDRGEFADGKYKTDFLITKKDWKNHPKHKELREAVLKVGRQHFGDQSLELSDFKNPFKSTDAMLKKKYKGKKMPASVKKIAGHVLIRAKTVQPPVVLGPDKEELSEKEVKKIKGGDWGYLMVVVAPYDQSGGGVTLYLQGAQFWKKGESFGDGKEKIIEGFEEFEVDVDDVEFDSDSDESEDDD